MARGRFLRRSGLRAGLGALAAAPFGAPASAAAAVAGGAQEHGVVAAVLAVGVGGRLLASRRRHRWLLLRVATGAGIGLATRAVWPVAPKAPAEVHPHRSYTDLGPGDDGAGVGIVVNPGAGSSALVAGSPAEALRDGLPAAEVVELGEGGDLVETLRRLAAGGVTAIGVAGGDGSINAAAGVAVDHGLPLVVVPAGTLNHLARDLGVETVDEAVEAVRSGHAAEIDVAWIDGQPFLNTASFGSYVALVDAREALERRLGKWPALAVALVRVLRHGAPIEVEVDGEHRELWLAFVGNCAYLPEGMAPTWRERLDDGQLDVRIVDAAHPFSRTRLVLAVLTGTLRRCRVFTTWRTTSLRVRSADGPLRLARDGETFDGPRAFEVSKNGARLAVFTPRRD